MQTSSIFASFCFGKSSSVGKMNFATEC